MPNKRKNTGFSRKSVFSQLKPNSQEGRLFGFRIMENLVLESRRSKLSPPSRFDSNGYAGNVCRLLNIAPTKASWKKLQNLMGCYNLISIVKDVLKTANESLSIVDQINSVINPADLNRDVSFDPPAYSLESQESQSDPLDKMSLQALHNMYKRLKSTYTSSVVCPDGGKKLHDKLIRVAETIASKGRSRLFLEKELLMIEALKKRYNSYLEKQKIDRRPIKQI